MFLGLTCGIFWLTTACAFEPESVVLNKDWKLISSEILTNNGEQVSMPNYLPPDKWTDAVVPGTVLTSFVKAGRYPDPYIGTNNQVTFATNGGFAPAIASCLIPDASQPGTAFTFPYWYRTDFTVPASFKGKSVWLKLAGVNWRGTVFLNGKEVGQVTGVFQRGIFDVTGLLRPGANGLAVKIDPLPFPGRPRNGGCGGDRKIGLTPATIYQSTTQDSTFVDGVRDRNMGILRNVSLYATGPVDVRDPFMSTEGVPTKDQANLNFKTRLVNSSDRKAKGRLTVSFADRSVSQAVTLAPGETREIALSHTNSSELVLKNPRLWWPAGYGEQSLYPMTVTFTPSKGDPTVVQSRFGVRSIENKVDRKQSVYWVNGHRMFLAGGNWMLDAMQKLSLQRDEAQIRMIRQAGLTWLRLWSGCGPVDDAFFDLCDQYGIMVWVEAGLCVQIEQQPKDPVWCKIVLDNWADYILRVRGHACVFNYVGCNEGPDISHMGDVVKQFDGTRGYRPSSQDLGQRGAPYRYLPIDGYYDYTNKDICGTGPMGLFGGFCNESGGPSLPVAEFIREQVPEEKLHPLDEEFVKYRDGKGFHRIFKFIKEGCPRFGDLSQPDLAGRTDVENFAFKGQMLNAMLYRALGEQWQRGKFNEQGLFATGYALWTVNSPWPMLCARLYDYSLEPTASLYYLAHANKPLHVQYNYFDNDVAAINNTFEPAANLKIRAEIRNLDWSLKWSKESTLASLPAESSALGLIAVPGKNTPGLDNVHFIRIQLLDSHDELLDDTIYWRSSLDPKYGADGDFSALGTMPNAQIKGSITSSTKDGKKQLETTLSNDSKQIAFFLRLKVLDGKTKKLIRPCFYSDNYFSLPPGEKKKVVIDCPASLGNEEPVVGVEGWNIGSLELNPQ